MARTGPVTKNTTTVTLGLAQVRVLASAGNINDIHIASASSDSIGALANTKYAGNTDWFKLESGYPLLEDTIFPIRETTMLECAFKEVTPYNMALAYGIDSTLGSYSEVHSGEIALGARTTPAFIRMEARYTFPNGTNYMDIIFPRAQISTSVELDLAAEDASAVPISFESKVADSNITGGSSVWDDKPLGRISWT